MLTISRLLVGYVIAYFSFFPFFHKHCRVRERDPDALQPEARLYWLLWSECPFFLNSISSILIMSSCTTPGNRPFRLCLDQFRTPACALDSANDFLITHCNSQREF